MSSDIRKKVLILALIGLVLSGVLLHHHVQVRGDFLEGPSFCTFSEHFDCDAVARSEFSEIFGWPVASLSLLYFIALLSFAGFARPSGGVSVEQFRNISLFLSLIAFLPTLAFAFVSVFILQKICLWCSLLYLTNLILLLVCVFSGKGLFGPLVEGAKLSFQFLASASKNDESGNLARVSFGIGLLLAGFVFFIPDVLSSFIFEQNPGISPSSSLEQKVEAWRKTRAKQIPLDYQSEGGVRDLILGPMDAPVQIIEFLDFECPHCKRASAFFKKLVAQYPEQIQLVMKHFPLDRKCNPFLKNDVHNFACEAALASLCIASQDEDLAWEAVEAIFSFEKPSQAEINELPQMLGLNQQKFQSCFQDPKFRTRIKTDIDLGVKLGLQGTPAIIINGRFLRSGFSESVVRAIVEQLLPSS